VAFFFSKSRLRFCARFFLQFFLQLRVVSPPFFPNRRLSRRSSLTDFPDLSPSGRSNCLTSPSLLPPPVCHVNKGCGFPRGSAPPPLPKSLQKSGAAFFPFPGRPNTGPPSSSTLLGVAGDFCTPIGVFFLGLILFLEARVQAVGAEPPPSDAEDLFLTGALFLGRPSHSALFLSCRKHFLSSPGICFFHKNLDQLPPSRRELSQRLFLPTPFPLNCSPAPPGGAFGFRGGDLENTCFFPATPLCPLWYFLSFFFHWLVRKATRLAMMFRSTLSPFGASLSRAGPFPIPGVVHRSNLFRCLF